MKQFIFSAIIIFSIHGTAQKKVSEKCVEGITKAKQDFTNGKAYFDHSRIEVEFNTNGHYESFYQVYMFSKYGIERDEYIHFESDEEQCYYAKMDTLIRKKYGKDIYLRSRRKAKEIFDSGELEKKSEILNLEKFYLLHESPPKFIGNDMLIKNIIKKMFKSTSQEKTEFEYYSVQLFIDRKGQVVDITSFTHTPKVEYSKAQIIKALNALGSFEPAYLYDVKVNAKLHL
ncbi:MAG: hypothetical protein AAF617_16010, partial [Bacteroidota bacterium]